MPALEMFLIATCLIGQSPALVDDTKEILAGIAAAGPKGTYKLPNRTLYIPSGLVLDASCNGATIQGSPQTMIVGGQPVSSWQPIQSSDPHYSDIPSGAQSHILVAPAQFLSITGSSPSVELYMGTSPQSQAVWPLPTAGPRSDGWLDVRSASKLAGIGQSQTFQHDSDAVPTSWNMARASSILVEGWAYDGRCFQGQLGSLDPSNTTVNNYSGYYGGIGSGNGSNNRFRYRNVLEELQLPGQYWVDSVNQCVYWYPPANYSNQPTYLSAGKGAITIKVANGLTLMGQDSNTPLEIIGNQSDAIDIQVSTNITLRYLQIDGCGGEGITTQDFRSSNITVDTCDFIGCGYGAIHLGGGDRLNRVPSGISIQKPYITNWGRLVGDHPAIDVSGMSPSVTDAYIANGPSAGILIGTYNIGVPAGQADGANDAMISGALIDGALSQMSDYGAIYLGRNWAALGNQIVNATIQNIHAYHGVGSPDSHIVWGIYLDDGQAGTTVMHCTIKNSDCGLTLGGGWGNTLSDLHFDNISRFSLAVDSRIANGHWGQAAALPTGAPYRSITQWFPWGSEPASWSAAYDNLDGQGHGLSAWMGLFSGPNRDPSYGLPLYNTISGITYGTNMTRSGLTNTDTYKPADQGWSYGGQSLIPSNVTQADSGGAPAFAGRTSPMAAGS